MSAAPVIGNVRPVAIAHRAANDLALLRETARTGVDLIEGDVWLYRGRVEVRHARTFWNTPVPLLWDHEGWTRWQVAAGWRPRLRLAEVLQAAGPTSELMLDLKGDDPRLPSAVLELVDRHLNDRPFTVCSRNWALLGPFRGQPNVTVVHSAAGRRELAALLSLAGAQAVSIHRGLLSPEVVRELKATSRFIMTWPVETWEEASLLLEWGVDGLISSDIQLLARLIALRHPS